MRGLQLRSNILLADLTSLTAGSLTLSLEAADAVVDGAGAGPPGLPEYGDPVRLLRVWRVAGMVLGIGSCGANNRDRFEVKVTYSHEMKDI